MKKKMIMLIFMSLIVLTASAQFGLRQRPVRQQQPQYGNLWFGYGNNVQTHGARFQNRGVRLNYRYYNTMSFLNGGWCYRWRPVNFVVQHPHVMYVRKAELKGAKGGLARAAAERGALVIIIDEATNEEPSESEDKEDEDE